MKQWEIVFNKWQSFEGLEPVLKAEVLEMEHDQAEDAFYKELTFGTGGMRGVLGAGINRMNIYTVRKAVNGLANYLQATFTNADQRGVAISYDSRHMSQEFALETAKVLGAYGIKAYVFASLHPTPLLSFAVRHLGACAGVMITASHNPPEYNGFKVYNDDGGQVIPEEADKIITFINQTENELTVPVLDQKQLEEHELLHWIGDEIDQAYLDQLKQISRLPDDEKQAYKDLSIVFTPLHGTAYDLVLKGLKQLNFPNVHVVEEQAKPDPEFSTVASPNPEEHQAFTMAMADGEQVDADILIGTDPDADRLGVAVKDANETYTVLTGNQLGSLILDYILTQSNRSDLRHARMIKTIVTTELGRAIASDHDVKTIDTLTGFKYIGEKIRQYDTTEETFIFGFEESYGYLISGIVRDKDAVQAAVMASELAYYWKKQGKTLLDALDVLYEKYGYYREGMTSLTLKGKEGAARIEAMMEEVRTTPLSKIGGLKVLQVEDYLTSERTLLNDGNKVEQITLPKENVVKYLLEHDSWVCFRPSGTEPKIKCYYGVCEKSSEASAEKLAALQQEMEAIMKRN
ncbi:phospho-sugar mutase [Lentibacillus sp. L22]|uniref:phospho-sugar mutase n=1 Tax=Lentibacillus TaxID=175304 RepID=UPI0022B13632|nr:phospho-sugar mutase [Lentibacillus daqui]